MRSMNVPRSRSQSGALSNHISELMTIKLVALSIRSQAASACDIGWCVLTGRCSALAGCGASVGFAFHRQGFLRIGQRVLQREAAQLPPMEPGCGERTMLPMTFPVVTERPMALEAITTDRFAVVVLRPFTTDLPPSRRRIVD